jgi:hypothetical protein
MFISGEVNAENLHHHCARQRLDGLGIFYLPLDWWSRGYLAMGVLMLIQSCVTMSKTARDQHEAARLVNSIEDARAERLLMEVDKAAA